MIEAAGTVTDVCGMRVDAAWVGVVCCGDAPVTEPVTCAPTAEDQAVRLGRVSCVCHVSVLQCVHVHHASCVSTYTLSSLSAGGQ